MKINNRERNFLFVNYIICFLFLIGFEGQKNQLMQQKDLLEQLILEVETKVSEISKSDLISMSGQFRQMFSRVHRQPMASVVSAPVPADFTR